MAWLAFIKEQRGSRISRGRDKRILMSFSLEGAISQPGGLILGGPEP